MDGAPWGLLNSLLEARVRDEQRVGRDRPVFLVGKGDVDTGLGRWAFLQARTELEIRARYPELTVVHGRPEWRERAVEEGSLHNVVADLDEAATGPFADLLANPDPR